MVERNLRARAAAVRANRERKPNDVDAVPDVRSATSVRDLRHRLEKQYPDLRRIVKATIEYEQALDGLELLRSGESIEGSDFLEAEIKRIERLGTALTKARDGLVLGGNLWPLYERLCEEEARLTELKHGS